MKLAVLSLAVVLFGGPVVAADDLESSLQSLKDAEAKGDVATIKKLAVETSTLARQFTAAAGPQGEDEREAWLQRAAWAKDVALYTEYALYAAALKGTPADTVDLLATLEQQNPKSKYLDQAYGTYLVALGKAGAAPRILVVAEKALENFPDNEDLLLVLADSALTQKQSDKALGYANRIVTVMNRHPKPEGVPDADWDRKKTAALARGYWISGVVSGEKSQHVNADKNLRLALPLIKGNDAMMAAALFYLGVSNYQLGKMTADKAKVLEGARFSSECAKLTSPYTEQAWKNANVMRTEAGRMR